MPRWIRITLRLFAALAGLVVLLWLGLAWYVTAHRGELLRQVTQKLSDQTGGTLRIQSMEPSLFRSFPNISLTLNGVSLEDSLIRQHHHRLLDVKRVFVKVNTFALLKRQTEIEKVTAAGGAIFLYTDRTGYSNTYLLQGKRDSDTTKKKKNGTMIAAFGLEDISLTFIHEVKQKRFQFQIRRLNGTTRLAKGVWQMQIALDAHVYQFCFNTVRGSYLKDKDLDVDIALTYDPAKKELYIPDQEIRISRQPLQCTGVFKFNEKPPTFAMRLHCADIPYKTAVSWVSQNISSKLDSFDFRKPVAVDVQINGSMAYRNIPLIRVNYIIKDNTLVTKIGDVDGVSFDGFYYNEAVAGNGHGDDNSQLQFRNVRGSWNELPFTMDTLNITNLLVPFVNVRVKSEFGMKTLNDVVGGDALQFDHGTALADLHYVGGILATDTTPYTINGFVKVSDAAIDYLPRNLQFRDVRATVLFRDDDLFLRDVHLTSGQSTVNMEGTALHFLRLYFTDPGKIAIGWRVQSPMLNLNDFVSFVGKRKVRNDGRTAKRVRTRIGDQLDKVLNASSINVAANVHKLVYRNFTADAVVAQASLAQSGIVIEKAALRHAGGTIAINGVINQDAANNPFKINADIQAVNVNRIFRSFDNFGQSAITYDNLQGRLTAKAGVTGKMNESGKILPGTMYGTVDFRLEDGVLDHFSPLEKISKFAFRNRNLSHVTFKDIHNTLAIEGNKIRIPPMTIESSAVNISLQGVYGMPKGTDIFMSIPLRNPEKEAPSTIVGKLLRRGKGIVINLRAQDGDEQGVKIGWDPFKKGQKALRDAAETP